MFTRVLTKKIDHFQISHFVGMAQHLERRKAMSALAEMSTTSMHLLKPGDSRDSNC